METAFTYRREGKQMASTRIERMLRELQSEPSHQFFERFFGLDAAAAKPQQQPVREPAIPVSLLKKAA
jgi:hypothetical protein